MRLSGHALEQTERLLLLRSIDTLKGVPAQHLAGLAEYAEERYFRPGEVLIRAGLPVDAAQLVLDGRVRLERGGRVLGHVGPRSGVGALSIMTRRPASTEAVADLDTLTLELRREPLIELMADDFAVYTRIAAGLAEAIIAARRAMGSGAGYPAQPAAAEPQRPARPLDLVERLFILRQAMGFATDRLNALVAMARFIDEQWLEPGEALWREGDRVGTTAFIRAGTVRGERQADGQTFFFNPGTFIGGLDNLAGRPRWFTALAHTHLHLLRIGFEDFFDVLEDRFDLAERFLAIFAGELLDLAERAAASAAERHTELAPGQPPPL